MNQTNIRVDPDDKKMKLDRFVVKKIVIGIVQSSYIFLSGLITKLVLDFYSVFLSVFQSLFHGGFLLLYSSL